MKKGVENILVTCLILFLALAGIFLISKPTGFAVQEEQKHTIGPSSEEQACMISCMKCTSPGVGCTGNQEQCQTQCNMKKPESTEETSCMEKCVSQGCKEYDFSCQSKNQDSCEKQCNMLGDKPDESTMSKEQKCISDCVNAESPGTRCQASQSGESGDELCQRCAKQCENLYEGPCLGEEKLEEKKKACQTCEHCYGEPVMGDSGEGWECIVDVECKDATSQFGDNPGSGPGIGQEGFIENVVESIGNFFKNLF